MKNKLLTITLFLSGSMLYGQEVISTQGNSYSNANGSIDYSIGEVVISTGTDGTNDLTQGFHQTNWNYVGLEDHSPNYEAIIFPNPTQEELSIKSSKFENVNYVLYDALGKKVIEGKLEGELTSFPVTELAPGNYSLALRANNETLKVFKLIKNQ